ncbi:MAG: EamA family transporter, partial [Desulfovibrionales bacterium]
MQPAFAAMAGRILLLGCERIVVKKLGSFGDSFSSAFLFFCFGALLLFPFTFLEDVTSYTFIGKAAVSSLVYAAAFVCYVKSLSIGEASLVSPLYNFNIFFLVLIAAVVLGESLHPVKIGGLLLLVYGATFLNRQGNWICSLGALAKDKACRLMMAGSLLIAVGRVIDKYKMGVTPPVTYSFILYSFVS